MQSNSLRVRIVKVAAVCLALMFCLGLTGCGCGRKPRRFMEHGYGKVNLDRITYVTPRIRIGVDEYALDRESIDRVIEVLKGDRYAHFHVKAVIIFDQFTWTAYQSESFSKDDNPVTRRDLAQIRRELRKVLRIYESIE